LPRCSSDSGHVEYVINFWKRLRLTCATLGTLILWNVLKNYWSKINCFIKLFHEFTSCFSKIFRDSICPVRGDVFWLTNHVLQPIFLWWIINSFKFSFDPSTGDISSKIYKGWLFQCFCHNFCKFQFSCVVRKKKFRHQDSKSLVVGNCCLYFVKYTKNPKKIRVLLKGKRKRFM